MQVSGKKMYHYHKVGIYDEIWQVGNEIIVDENFISHYCTVLSEFDTTVPCAPDGHPESFDRVLTHYLSEEELSNLDLQMLKQLLEESKRIIKNTNIFKRELALEECRKKYFPTLPSRLHSIWVTDEENLEFWQSQLNKGDLELFELELYGELFESSDLFIPDDELSMGDSIVKSRRYWDPDFDTISSRKQVEFLFQGNVKILRKVN